MPVFCHIETHSVLLTDEETQISGIETLFLDQNVMVTVDGVEWEFSNSTGGDFEVKYETFVDDELQDSGTISLVGTGRELPTSFDVGVIKAEDKGEVSISVTLTLDENEVSTDSTHQAFKAGNAIWPLLLVLCKYLPSCFGRSWPQHAAPRITHPLVSHHVLILCFCVAPNQISDFLFAPNSILFFSPCIDYPFR